MKSFDKITDTQGSIIKFFNEQIITHNKEQKAAYALQQATLNSIHTSMKHVESAQYTKDSVKWKCMDILNYYIQHREAMGMMSKQVEKDSLIQSVQQQMKNV